MRFIYFNPRSRKGFDRCTAHAAYQVNKFQSTKPQRLRLKQSPKSENGALISIHEAAKASTNKMIYEANHKTISIYEAAKASTPNLHYPVFWKKFQSTKPQRLRRGAYCNSFTTGYFNPRSRKGFDSFQPDSSDYYAHFNPRSRKGFDILEIPTTLMDLDFNPRSRKGFDHLHIQSENLLFISIHEAAKASTVDKNGRRAHPGISIHEAAKASTHLYTTLILTLKISIHEAAKASTVR